MMDSGCVNGFFAHFKCCSDLNLIQVKTQFEYSHERAVGPSYEPITNKKECWPHMVQCEIPESLYSSTVTTILQKGNTLILKLLRFSPNRISYFVHGVLHSTS